MADEPESLVLRLLQEIRADVGDVKRDVTDMKAVQAEHTRELASIRETLRLHGMRLDSHTQMFVDVGRTLQDLTSALRGTPSNDPLEPRRQ